MFPITSMINPYRFFFAICLLLSFTSCSSFTSSLTDTVFFWRGGDEFPPSSDQADEPRDGRSLFLDAVTAMDAGRYGEGARGFQEAMELYPELMDYHYYFASLCHVELGSYDEALRLSGLCIEVAPEEM